jgi:copper(I)-binding protein
MMKHLAISAIAAALTVLPAHAAPNATVTDGWFRALPSNLPAGGYFTLHNEGSQPLALTGASSPACGMLMLHKSEEIGGMSHMEDLSSVDVPAGGEVKFAPGGYHLMCMNPGAAMKPGAVVNVTLGFRGGESLEAPFAVRNAAGK